MSNMSYCRFENTMNDLRDCREALMGLLDGAEAPLSVQYELPAAKRLAGLCIEILDMLAEKAECDISDLDDRKIAAVLDRANRNAEAEELARENAEAEEE